MKTGILTFHRALNYGAVLQAYALRKTVSRLGFNCEIIDYGKVGDEPRINLNYKRIKPFIATFLLFLLSLFNADKRRKRFFKFRKEYLGITTTRYLTTADLSKANDEFNIFITGSDQVWNPYLSGSDMNYLLEFVNNENKKIAYAASFGISTIPNDLQSRYHELLARFNDVSVRESQGQNIIRKLNNSEAKLVLDPVFLLSDEQWSEIAIPAKINEPYILCFVIMQDPPGFMNFCRHIEKLTGYRIIRIANPKYKIEFGLKVIANAGPREFLGLIKNAAIVITNSFHGTAFSIVFRKPFYTFLYNTDRDIRLKEITGKLGLEKRLIGADFNKPAKISETELDYSNANSILNMDIEASVKFLENALRK